MAQEFKERGTLFVSGICLGPAERSANGTIEAGPHITKRAARDRQISVVRVDQSPMNPKQWALTLACGHESWVTASKRPARKTATCERCLREL